MSAIEVARTLHEAGIELDHPLEVVIWSNEEGGKTGSRSWAGTILERELDLPSLGDKKLGEGMVYIGGDPERLAQNARSSGDVAGYIELHVEQGAILDSDGIDIGVVEGIVPVGHPLTGLAAFVPAAELAELVAAEAVARDGPPPESLAGLVV